MSLKSVTLTCLALALATFTISPAGAQSGSQEQIESRLRQSIEDLQNGRPNLDQMEPMLRVAVEQQQASVVRQLTALGRVTSIEYVGLQNGGRIYKVTFERGVTAWGIALSPNGKTAALYFQPVQ